MIQVSLISSSAKADSLAYQLAYAAQAVAAVRAGSALPQALAQIFARADAPPPARGAIQDISYRAMRRLGVTDALLALLANKPPEPEVLRGLLDCALALLVDEEEAGYDGFTVVNQAVEAAAASPDMAFAKGVVNAILRRFQRERATLMPQATKTPPGTWNYPTWWIDRLKGAYPDDWQRILYAGNQAPPLTLRVNRRQATVEQYLATLAAAGMPARQVGPSAVRLDKPVPVQQIPGFADGAASVQDAAAQLAAPLLDAADGMRVLDACAAPGGKTGHLLELADIELQALDHDGRRLARIDENLRRLGLTAQLIAGDARQRDGWWDGKPFDRILADVPCTASGIVRRHPDIRWLRRKTDTAQLATLSAQILDNLWQMLRPDGKLLLVTCSLWPQESEQQAIAFAQRNNAIRLPAPGQLLPTASAETDHDGLFYALFQKTGA
ncbi:16S rRNA (cytosine(967)-C(5))-methyltransferase RsmB [Herbaspirillum sp. WKF16]|uniref:16S rRNA (cytosine(967)-C(5))-methyltransferase RsmB n=1 Tax=Herbaspirillum sp. WKF16 TaxID=3028312 RepID=UPI0023A923B4|nr:16S rRNA (cytosine(967)-C(5))-methyltransferase RsmB [Herbaspirillum sp. WKF16]WDZ96295.1 16S rRNA (cytosine(967)-C(5))-methyltransferase RsmB [Herbaspirillum sp. WKF16]